MTGSFANKSGTNFEADPYRMSIPDLSYRAKGYKTRIPSLNCPFLYGNFLYPLAFRLSITNFILDVVAVVGINSPAETSAAILPG